MEYLLAIAAIICLSFGLVLMVATLFDALRIFSQRGAEPPPTELVKELAPWQLEDESKFSETRPR